MVDGLDRLIFTLVQVLLGDSFHGFMREILVYIPWAWVYFYGYISVGSIVLLNLVTAIIVENARENSESDHAHAIREKEAEKSRSLRKLRRLFRAMDQDQSNSISWDEFQSSFKDPAVLEYWTLLNFSTEECAEVWQLIDDGDGVIEIDEFVDALTRMEGMASAKDLFRLQRSITMLHQSLDKIAGVRSLKKWNSQ